MLLNQTQAAPGLPLFAPAGGGGSASVPANLGVSTLIFGGSSNPALFMGNKAILLNSSTSTAAIGTAALAWNNASSNITLVAPSTTYVYIATNQLNGNLRVYDDGVFASPFLSTPNLQVSSINGAAPGVMSSIANGAANISIPAGSNPVLFNLTEGASFTTPGNAGSLLLNGNITNNATTTALFNQGVQATTLSTLNLQVSTINGAVVAAPTPNLTLSTLNLNGGANQINMASLNTAESVVWATGNGLTLSSIKTLNGGVPITTSVTPFNNPVNFQTGYLQDYSNASTILFTVPFSNDNVCVMLTPTNRNISGGANPQLSLCNAFGNHGVSSIGFQVDARNGGVAYDGSFFYLATSL